jgi:adenosine deaminase CECR1
MVHLPNSNALRETVMVSPVRTKIGNGPAPGDFVLALRETRHASPQQPVIPATKMPGWLKAPLPVLRHAFGLNFLQSLLVGLLLPAASLRADGFSSKFDDLKRSASPADLYRFLYATPKAGDLHHHQAGDWRMEDLYRVATNAPRAGGNRFYTRVKAGTCDNASNSWERFTTISSNTWSHLTSCEQQEFLALDQLPASQQLAWMNSVRLDQPGEGRDEFFERIWPRLGALLHDPYVGLEMLVETMKRYGAEGVTYLEPQVVPEGWVHPDGTAVDREEFYQRAKARLAEPDAVATGVTVRFQVVVIRFAPSAESRVESAYQFVDQHRDLFVGINMAGREDNNKGFPRRFLDVYRKMRHRYSGIKLSIHGGEADEPNQHGRDTLLLGATRIGHGVNLITDEDLLLHLRSGIAMVEINLVSNLLLEYVKDYREHPFPEYLRTGIPVALSTDDSGMWDSNMTDEYFTAVREFNVTWEELISMGRNSLAWSFCEEPAKSRLLRDYDQRVKEFEQRCSPDSLAAVKTVKPVTYGFARRRWGIEF